MKPPDDEDPSVDDDPLLGDAPVVVELSPADFEAMLGSFTDLALHGVLGDDDDGHEPRPRVGRYERRDP